MILHSFLLSSIVSLPSAGVVLNSEVIKFFITPAKLHLIYNSQKYDPLNGQIVC